MKSMKKTYLVRWFLDNGFEYKATSGCHWEDVLKCRKLARALGETIKYEVEKY